MGDIPASKIVFNESDMLQIQKSCLTFTEDEIIDLKTILQEEDESQALRFLSESVYRKIIRAQIPYDPRHGTIGFRRNPFGYQQIGP